MLQAPRQRVWGAGCRPCRSSNGPRPPARSPPRPKLGPSQISGNLEIWELEIWKFEIQTNPKNKNSQNQNPFCQNVGRVWISRGEKKLLAPFGARPGIFLRG